MVSYLKLSFWWMYFIEIEDSAPLLKEKIDFILGPVSMGFRLPWKLRLEPKCSRVRGHMEPVLPNEGAGFSSFEGR